MHSTEVQGQEEALALGLEVPLWNEQADFIASEWVPSRHTVTCLSWEAERGELAAKLGKEPRRPDFQTPPLTTRLALPY